MHSPNAYRRTSESERRDVPQFFYLRVRDLKFLLAVEKLENLPPDREEEAGGLLVQARNLYQASLKKEFDPIRFADEIAVAREYIQTPDFEELKAHYEAYVDAV